MGQEPPAASSKPKPQSQLLGQPENGTANSAVQNDADTTLTRVLWQKVVAGGGGGGYKKNDPLPPQKVRWGPCAREGDSGPEFSNGPQTSHQTQTETSGNLKRRVMPPLLLLLVGMEGGKGGAVEQPPVPQLWHMLPPPTPLQDDRGGGSRHCASGLTCPHFGPCCCTRRAVHCPRQWAQKEM